MFNVVILISQCPAMVRCMGDYFKSRKSEWILVLESFMKHRGKQSLTVISTSDNHALYACIHYMQPLKGTVS
jgi:hypothetical protein